MHRPSSLAAFRALAAALFVLLPVSASAVVVPGSLEFVEGGGSNCVPLTGCSDIDRYQQVYDASEFSGPIWISEIRLAGRARRR